MAYLSSTTTAPNVPQLVTQGIAKSSSGSAMNLPRTWIWNSTHISSDIEAANWITDGQELGLKVGDLVVHTNAAYVTTSHTVLVVGATTTNLSVGTTIGLGS